MTGAEFRNALANLQFLELPKLIDLTLYDPDLAAAWRNDPIRSFFCLTNGDQDKVFAAICANQTNIDHVRMSEMVMKVASAIHANDLNPLESMPKRYQDMARAAIKAMREPTEAMVDQGYSYFDEDALVARRPPTGRGRLFFAWQAMIDSAIL